jgi:sulfur dioxygenase
MIFEQLNPSYCKTYLIALKESVLLIDPLLDHIHDYLKLLNERNLTLTHVIDTHTHADHISGGAALKDMTGCKYLMHKNAVASCVSLPIDEQKELQIGDLKSRILYTPGHTEDSISLIIEDRLLTGDLLFLDDGGGGRDDLPGGDPGKHWESLQKILNLPEHLVVYPAHDYRNRKPSSLKNQKKINPHLQKAIESKKEFVQYITNLKLGPADWMKEVLSANYFCARDPKAAWVPADISACEVMGTAGVNDQEVVMIGPLDLKEKLKKKLKLVLLDVREPWEFKSEVGYIDGVLNIPIIKLPEKIKNLEKKWKKQDEIITICHSGGRAFTAAQILQQSGFKNVIVLDGGMVTYRKVIN